MTRLSRKAIIILLYGLGQDNYAVVDVSHMKYNLESAILLLLQLMQILEI